VESRGASAVDQVLGQGLRRRADRRDPDLLQRSSPPSCA
jgi:hypothetical protein